MKVAQNALLSDRLKHHLAGLGDKLRASRIQCKLTQGEVANECGLSRQTVSRIERGDASVAVGQIGRLAERIEALNLLGGEIASKPDVAGRRVRSSKDKS
jgi:transcriptional regulator with XRE-family HTH domain